MDKYNFNKAKYGTHVLIGKELNTKEKILDVGCNKGYIKLASSGKGIFYGIDFVKRDIDIAKKVNKYSRVYKLNLNDFKSFKIKEKFDTIIFADVLEHLMKPDAVLKYFTDKFLNDNGRVIISLPNVANIAIRINLLCGNFEYTESGILDKTHFHLYTIQTAKSLIESAGLKIEKKKFSSNNFGWLVEIFPFLGSLLGYNLIFICKKRY